MRADRIMEDAARAGAAEREMGLGTLPEKSFPREKAGTELAADRRGSELSISSTPRNVEVPLMWVTSKELFRATINEFRAPLLSLHRCFAATHSATPNRHQDPSASKSILPVFALIQILKSFEAVHSLLLRGGEKLMNEVKDSIAVLLGTFLLVIDTLFGDSLSVQVFLKLNGLQLIKALLEIYKVDDPVLLNSSSGREVKQSVSNLSTRLVNVIASIAEACAEDDQLFKILFEQDFFTDMIVKARGSLKLQMFNCVVSPFINIGEQDLLIRLCPWDIIIETIFSSTKLPLEIPPSIRGETLSLIYQLLECEEEQSLNFRTTDGCCDDNNDNNEDNKDNGARINEVTIPMNSREQGLASYLQSKTQTLALLPCCSNAGDSDLEGLGSAAADITDHCHSCNKYRTRDREVFWAYNKCVLPIALSMKKLLTATDNDQGAIVE